MINIHSKKTVFFLFFVIFIFCASQASALRLTPRMKNKKTREVQTKPIERTHSAPIKSQSSIVNPDENEIRMPKYSLPTIVEDDYIEDDDDIPSSRKAYGKNRLSSYVAGRAGAVFYEGQKWWNVEIENTTGQLLTVAIGQRFMENLRAEAEVQYQRAKTTARAKIGGEQEEATITASNFSILGNLYFDFLPQKTVSPFIMLGVGYGRQSENIEHKLLSINDNLGTWVFTFGAGLSLQMQDDLFLDLCYRNYSFTAYQYNTSVSINTNACSLGLRYAF